MAAQKKNWKERAQVPYWDTLIRGTVGAFQPRAVIDGTIELFKAANAGTSALGNMPSAGTFPSRSMYLVYIMRVLLYFQGCTPAGVRDFIMYHWAAHQLYFKLVIGDKTYFECPAVYLPFGGGLHGDLGTSTDVQFTNGSPSHTSVLRLAKPIPLRGGETFHVDCVAQAMGTANIATAISTTLTAGECCVQFWLDGVLLRDVK